MTARSRRRGTLQTTITRGVAASRGDGAAVAARVHAWLASRSEAGFLRVLDELEAWEGMFDWEADAATRRRVVEQLKDLGGFSRLAEWPSLRREAQAAAEAWLDLAVATWIWLECARYAVETGESPKALGLTAREAWALGRYVGILGQKHGAGS
jgi:hypothetical protein